MKKNGENDSIIKKLNQKGITLVALVVTIVVLLILAGITINMLLGENGIIRIAQEAKNTWENAIINEQESLNSLLDELNDELRDKSKDIYVFLYDDGTLAFSNKNELIQGKTLVKEYGNIADKEYEPKWIDGVLVTNTPWYEDRNNIFKVNFLDEIKPTSTFVWFATCKQITQIEGINHLNTKYVTNMGRMFEQCENLTDLDVSNFDTQNVTNMENMFAGCINVKELDVSNFDTSNVTNMGAMFNNCKSLTTLDVSNFDTSRNTNMYYMFSYLT